MPTRTPSWFRDYSPAMWAANL